MGSIWQTVVEDARGKDNRGPIIWGRVWDRRSAAGRSERSSTGRVSFLKARHFGSSRSYGEQARSNVYGSRSDEDAEVSFRRRTCERGGLVSFLERTGGTGGAIHFPKANGLRSDCQRRESRS
jgi:hypothetical protein